MTEQYTLSDDTLTRRAEDRYWLATVNEEGVRLRAGEEEARAEFRAWLAEHDAKVRAEAWDEGADDIAEYIENGGEYDLPNPYRTREEQS